MKLRFISLVEMKVYEMSRYDFWTKFRNIIIILSSQPHCHTIASQSHSLWLGKAVVTYLHVSSESFEGSVQYENFPWKGKLFTSSNKTFPEMKISF